MKRARTGKCWTIALAFVLGLALAACESSGSDDPSTPSTPGTDAGGGGGSDGEGGGGGDAATTADGEAPPADALTEPELPPDVPVDVQGNVATANVGADGGTIRDPDGRVVLSFPEGALAADTAVTLTFPENPAAGGVAPQVDITLDPAPDEALPLAAWLSFPGQPAENRVMRFQPTVATVSEKPDDLDLPGGFWLPLSWSRSDEDGAPAAVLAGFSTYGSGPRPTGEPECNVPWEATNPPPTPPGMIYVGYHVVINFVMDENRSTAPITFVELPSDDIHIVSATTIQDFTATCDWIVAHIFIPEGDADRARCFPTAEQLVPPPTPPNHRYVGYDIVINHHLVDSTVPLSRPERPSDHNHISSHTTVEDGVTKCDIIVRHLFEPIPRRPDGEIIPPDDPWQLIDIFDIPDGEDYDIVTTETGFPPLPDEPAPDVPAVTGSSLYGACHLVKSAHPAAMGTGVELYIDYAFEGGQPQAAFIQTQGGNGFLTATGFEVQEFDWNPGHGSVQLLFDMPDADKEDTLGHHVLRVGLAGAGSAGSWEKVSNYLLVPFEIITEFPDEETQ